MTTRAAATATTLLALIVLVLNDRVWKQTPTVWTGKLSDVTGLFLVPTVMLGAADAVTWLGGNSALLRRFAMAACLLVGAVFVAVKTHAGAALLLASIWPWPGPTPIVRDPTDVWTLPFLALGWWTAEVTFSARARVGRGVARVHAGLRQEV